MKKLLIAIVLLLFTSSISSQNIGVELFAEGFSQPLEIATAGDDRLFVVEKGGEIKIANADGSVNEAAFLTIPASQLSFGVERGLLGLAFHPNYSTNGYFYVCYTRVGDGAVVVSRYEVSDTDPNLADQDSEFAILTILHPVTDIHNAGTLRFGPDGYLYISSGDGGWPQTNAQDTSVNLGKILRIDVDNPEAPLAYGIPSDNPYVGIGGNDEIWAKGLRNPWKFSFDKETHDLWITDVGQSSVEEINHVPSTVPAMNYGWSCYEGNDIFLASECVNPGSFEFPIATYPHGEGSCSITGGFVYRGTEYPSLVGKYFFTDFCRSRIGTVDAISHEISFTADLGTSYSFTTFGEASNGALYLASFGQGKVYKIIDNDLSNQLVSKTDAVLFPNPATRQANLKLPDGSFPATAKIYDMSGKLILKKKILNEVSTLDVSSLQKGIYVVSVLDAIGNSSKIKLAKL